MIRPKPERLKFVRASIFSVTLTMAMLMAGQATAQEPRFGERGHLVLSAERLTGFIHTSATASFGGQEMSTSQDTFTLFGNPIGGIGTGYAWPRIALDGFVAQNISLGAAVTIFHVAPESGSTTGFLLAPRVGYAAVLSERVAFWPRVGFTFERASSSGGVTSVSRSQSLYALTVEAPLVFVLAPRTAITAGPTLDLGLGGSLSADSSLGQPSIDQKFTDFGVQAGLLMFF